MTERRELYRSPNGDSWFLGREPMNGHAFIIHQPNDPSGGRLSHIELGAFLRGTGTASSLAFDRNARGHPAIWGPALALLWQIRLVLLDRRSGPEGTSSTRGRVEQRDHG